MKVSKNYSKYFNGYVPPRSSNTSPGESIDVKENVRFPLPFQPPFLFLEFKTFKINHIKKTPNRQTQLGWRYDPKYDPEPKPLDEIPEGVKAWLRGEDFVWEGTSHLPSFKEDTLAYWTACLTLSRKLVKIFALSLDIDEDYFDSRTTYPGADGVYNYYPENSAEEKASNAVGLGSHTDLQLFTLLWQDMVGGLQVLNKEGQWIKAKPVEGTIVVNIGDFMMRLCNDRYKSTVHRVYNKSNVERVSMPFFFGKIHMQLELGFYGQLLMIAGLNFNCVEGVVPSCTSETNPPKYEPISCGECKFSSIRRQVIEANHIQRVSDEIPD